jgi:hypothetical protein
MYVFKNVPFPVQDSSLSTLQPNLRIYHALTLPAVRCLRFWSPSRFYFTVTVEAKINTLLSPGIANALSVADRLPENVIYSSSFNDSQPSSREAYFRKPIQWGLTSR